jgi:hypothetical protein
VRPWALVREERRRGERGGGERRRVKSGQRPRFPGGEGKKLKLSYAYNAGKLTPFFLGRVLFEKKIPLRIIVAVTVRKECVVAEIRV